MSFRHPANRRSAQAPYGDGMFFFTRPVGAPDEISEGEYGDGMFFFTRPVGAPDDVSEGEYGDGAFFFTQPVGAPQSIRPGTYGRANAYGAAKAADVKKAGAGLRATLKGGGLDPTKNRTAKVTTKYADVSSADLAAFEKAAGDAGVWSFWAGFWQMQGSAPMAVTRAGAAVSGSRGTVSNAPASVSSTSKSALSDATTKASAAKTNLDAAKQKLLSAVPNATASSGTAAALDTYASVLSANGWYGQAFRNVSGSTRKAAGTVIDAIRRDAMDPYVKGTLSLTNATKIARGYILSDVESYYGDAAAWKIEEPTTKNKKLKYGKVDGDDVASKGVGWLVSATGWSLNLIDSVFSKTKGWDQDLIVKDGTKNYYFVKQSDAETYRTYLKQRDFRNAVMTSAFNTEISNARSAQVKSRDTNTANLSKKKQAFLDARKKAFDQQIAIEQADADKQNAVAAVRSKRAEAERLLEQIRGYATEARSQRTAAETAATVTFDQSAASTAATAANAAAVSAQSALSQVKSAADAAKSSASKAGGLADADATAASTAYADANSAVSEAESDAELANAQVTLAAANKKAADDKAAADVAAAEAAAAEAAAADAAAKVAAGQMSQAEADALKATAAAERAEADRLAGVATASADNAEKIREASLPEDKKSLIGSPKSEKVGFLTASGTGEESFVSKYKLWIGLGSVAAIGGGYWWYTQKYLPSKKLGR
jgi:hypothetical protein